LLSTFDNRTDAYMDDARLEDKLRCNTKLSTTVQA
jgi:hypothetical protein